MIAATIDCCFLGTWLSIFRVVCTLHRCHTAPVSTPDIACVKVLMSSRRASIFLSSIVDAGIYITNHYFRL